MKKILKSLVIGLLAILLIEVYGKKFVQFISDTYQNSITVNGIQINKPKGWLPAIVKNNGTSRILNIINEKYLFTDASNYYFKNNKNGILLTNHSNKIVIIKLVKNTDRDYMTKTHFNNKEFYIMKKTNFTIIIYPEKKIIMMMDLYIPEVIDEIVR